MSVRAIFAGVMAALLAVPAAMASPAGIWEIEMRDSRYRVGLR